MEVPPEFWKNRSHCKILTSYPPKCLGRGGDHAICSIMLHILFIMDGKWSLQLLSQGGHCTWKIWKYLENSFFHIFTLKYLELYLARAPHPSPAKFFIYPKSHIDKIPHFSCSYTDLCFRIILSCFSFMVTSDIWKNCLNILKIPGKYDRVQLVLTTF